MKKYAIITMDVEDWYHTYFPEANVDRSISLLDGLDVALDIMKKDDIHGSFFVVGEIADKLADTQHNNMAQFEPALIMRWIFKTAISVWLISNTFDIVMAVFDVTQKVVSDSSSIIAGNTRVNDIGLSMLQSSLMQMDVGPLFGLFLQSFFIGITMRILSIVIFVIVYGRMIEIYCMVSLAPIPMATFGNHEQSHMGQNYLKCLFALGFQGFLILICVAIYAVLIQSVAISGDAINSIWSIVGYTVLLCFSLFKTSSVTKSVLGAH